MITLRSQYEIDPHKPADFDKYARNWPEASAPTDAALALIRFRDQQVPE